MFDPWRAINFGGKLLMAELNEYVHVFHNINLTLYVVTKRDFLLKLFKVFNITKWKIFPQETATNSETIWKKTENLRITSSLFQISYTICSHFSALNLYASKIIHVF